MKHGNFFFGLKFCQRLLEAHGLINRFFNELLHQRFAPGVEHAAPEAAGKPAYAGEADSFDFGALAIEHGDSGLFEHLADEIRLTGFEIMITEHGKNRHVHGRAKIDNQLFGFFGQAIVGQIAAEQEDICLLRAFGEEIVQRAAGMFSVMNIGNRGDAQFRLVHSEIGNGCARRNGRDARKLRSIRVVEVG